jgi:hypothetical protein
MRMMGGSASGNWDNYHVAGEYMNIRNLFTNKFIKMVIFLNICMLDKNSTYLDSR